jgi:hypothetical protein
MPEFELDAAALTCTLLGSIRSPWLSNVPAMLSFAEKASGGY